jgi:HAD superfamily hydrolase (TIGR01549 family)
LPTKSIQSLTGRTIRCLLFDLGETLWTRTDKITWRTLEESANLRAVSILHEHISLTPLPTTDDRALGQRLREAVETEVHAMTRQAPEHEPDFGLAATRALLDLGLPKVERVLGDAIFEALRLRIPESRHLFNDVFPTLSALQQRGFLLGVVTNRHHGGIPFAEDLRTIGLLDYFESRHIAVSADLGIRKPNPTIFLHVLNAFGVPPQEAAMVGDSLRADIVGARNLNIFAIWKPNMRLRQKVAEAQAADAASEVEVEHTDNGYLLKYIHTYGLNYDQKKLRQSYSRPEPDLIIEHTRDLLDIFSKAGKQ